MDIPPCGQHARTVTQEVASRRGGDVLPGKSGNYTVEFVAVQVEEVPD
jgi:hypothetical protein